MVISKNILFNLFSRIINSFGQILFIPLYIEILGIDQYSKILLIFTFVAFFSVFEFGLGQTIIRELGQFKEDIKYHISKVFASAEKLIFLLCIFLSVFIFFIVKIFDFSISGFTNLDDLIFLTILLICSQIIFNFYFQINFIRQDQKIPNYLSIFYSLIKQLIIIFPLLFFPNIEFFLSWQIAVNFLFSIVLRMIVINLYCLDRMTISLKNIMEFIQSKYKIFMPLFFISIINVALTQSDKIFVGTSNFELFKFYALGSLLASSLTIISNAIGTSYFSKLYSDSINIKDGKQSEIFYLVYYVLMVILIPIFVFMSSLSNEILLIWLKYPEFVNNTIVIFNILLFANFITFIQTPSFHLFISKGLPKYNLYFGIVSASILVPSYYLLSLRGLIMEIAIMYLITQFVTSFVYTYYSCKILEWQFSYKKIVLYPLIYILGVIFLSLFIHFLHFSAYIKISISVLSYAFYAWLSHNKLKKLYEFNT